MTESLPELLPEGLEDLLPDKAESLGLVQHAMLECLSMHGYRRVAPPMIEFERSLAKRMDGVQRRKLFRFVDPASLRTLALRSDITVQIGRIATTRLAAEPRPLRLCYCGQTLRIAADQLQPERELSQLGAELIGTDSAAAAAEMVSLAIDALAQAGIGKLTVDFTMPDLVRTLAASAFPVPDNRLDAVMAELDTKDAGGLTALGAEDYLPLLFATGPFDRAMKQLKAIDAGGALASRIQGLEEIAARIGDKVQITLDPTERHGFEYQRWFGFTIFAEGLRGHAGRGGTYAVRRADGSEEPAVGFSLFPDELVDILPSRSPRTVYLPIGHDPAQAAELRSQGYRTIAVLDGNEDPIELGCTHKLSGNQLVSLN